tara:strand:+ start:11231 stop:11539 length:309 start_codon:yes stop_codon:yes gene_type:complete
MSEYDNRGSVSLWKPESDNPKAPAARGTVVAHRDIREGEEVDIALWRNDSDNPKAPLMKGKISDKFKPSGQSSGQQYRQASQGGQQPQGGYSDEELDDPLPF